MRRWMVGLFVLVLVLLGRAAGDSAGARPSAASLVRWPYVQDVTPTAATIAWATDTGGAAELRLSTDGVSWQPVAALSQTINGQVYYVAALADLQPATRYYYRTWVDATDLTPWAAVAFTTTATGADFTFAAFGDSRGGSQAARDLAVQMADPSRPFDLAIHTGDIAVAGAYSQFDDEYFGVYRDLIGRIPFFTAPGNHDYGASSLQPYLDDFILPRNGPVGLEERVYSFDWGQAHFVALDTFQSYAPGSPQYAWLENDLAATQQLWKFVFFHYPPYSSSSHGSDLAVRNALAPLFERYGVDLIFTGHDHSYERTQPMIGDSVAPAGRPAPVYFVTGGGGAPLYPLVTANSFTAYFQSVYHYTRTEVHGCTLTLQAIDKAGVVFDTFTLDKCGNRLQELAPGLDYRAWFQQHTGYAPQADYFGAYSFAPLTDTLFIGFGAGRPADVDGALLAGSDGVTVTALYSPTEQGFVGMTAVGGTLYVPGPDPCCASVPPGQSEWDWGNVYTYTPPGMVVKHRNLPKVIHTWGLWYDASRTMLFAAAGAHTGDYSTWTGGVFGSTDQGASWASLADATDGIGQYRTYDIIGLNNKLYVTWNDVYGDPCGLAVSTDGGQHWTRLPDLTVKTACRTRLAVFQNQVLVLKSDQTGIFSVDTNDAVVAHEFPGFKVRDWAYNYLASDGAGYLYTVTDDGRVVRSSDLQNWRTMVSTDLPLMTVAFWPEKNWLIVADRGVNAKIWKLDLSVSVPYVLSQAPTVSMTVGGSSLKLDWADVTLDVAGQALPVRGYRVYRSSLPYFTSEAANWVAAPTLSEFSDTIGGPDNNRFYRIRTEDAAGQLSVNSGRVGVFSFALQPGQ